MRNELTKGIKHDQDKIRLDLLSTTWVEGVGQVLTFGARKYADHNWAKGLSRSRLMGACLRHVFSYLRGEDCDRESGLSHLYHASCCLMFASELHITKPETDDRRRHPEAQPPRTTPHCEDEAQERIGMTDLEIKQAHADYGKTIADEVDEMRAEIVKEHQKPRTDPRHGRFA